MRLVHLVVGFALVLGAGTAWPYDIDSHRAIAQQAVELSSVDSVLKATLGLSQGVDTLFEGKPAADWMRDGAGFEDQPFPRVLRHFHNPTRQWEQAGLTILGVQVGQSSVLWQQNRQQDQTVLAGTDGSWAWPNARDYYLQALISPVKDDRDTSFAKLFRSLGQVMHLVQDATVPAHVRNDPHPPLVNPDWYEDWVHEARLEDLAKFQMLLTGAPVVPAGSIFAATGNAQAPAPVARLIDTSHFQLGQDLDALYLADLGVSE